MDISPQRVRTVEFQTVKRGLDPDEVREFLQEVANELERAQNQSTAMEARARAAVARLQEISESTPSAQPAEQAEVPARVEPSVEIRPSVDQAETISRTLILAQRTADQTVAEAESEAARLREEAETEAERSIETSRQMSERLLDEARDEARRTGEAERIRVESEVNALMARRDFLESDVDHLQAFLVDERSRLRDAAASMLEVADRVPAGLGEVRRPLLSAADDDAATATGDDAAAMADETDETDESDRPADPGDDGSAVDVESGAGADGEDDEVAGDDRPGSHDLDPDDPDDESSETLGTREITRVDATPSGEPDQLVIRTDIADDGPTGFSYDDRSAD